MLPLKPGHSIEKYLGQERTRVFRSFGALRIPCTRDCLRAMREWIVMEDEPFAPAGNAAGVKIEHVDKMRGRVLDMRGPTDFGVEGFVGCSV